MNTYVFDTNIIVSGLKSNLGASFKLIEMFVDKKFEIALSLPLYREYWEVTERDVLEIDSNARKTILQYFSKNCIATKIHFKWRPFLKDENDNMVLETAISSNANIVTHNVKDFLEVESKFNVRILKPQEVLYECR